LSKDTKSIDPEQRIVDVARNERSGLLIIIMGVFLINAGLIVSVIGNSTVAYIGGSLIVALGVFSTMFGFYISVRYSRQYNDFLKD
jgi:hypothetical protein